MSDLRAQVVEAMAQAIFHDRQGDEDYEWEHEVEVGIPSFYRSQAEAALDAALGVLGENVEGWCGAAVVGAALQRDVTFLLAVLRDSGKP